MRQLKSVYVVLVTSLILSACNSDSHNSQSRVVDLLPDAPASNISVNSVIPAAVTGVEYRQASPFLSVDKGWTALSVISDELQLITGNYQVRIIPANTTTVVYNSGSISLEDGVEYVAIAADDIDSDSLVGLKILTDLADTPLLNVNNAALVAEWISLDKFLKQ